MAQNAPSTKSSEPKTTMSSRRVATKSSVAKVASSSVAMPRSRCTTKIAIEPPQPMKSGPKYLTLARNDHGRALPMTSAISAKYAAKKRTMKSLISSIGSYSIGPSLIQSRAPLISTPKKSSKTNKTSDATTQRYLYAAKRRKAENAGPNPTASASDTSSHSCCRCANAGESRSTIASPSDASTTASAGNPSSRTVEAGCQITQTIASAARIASNHGGPIVWRGANDRISAATASAPNIGATRRTKTVSV